MTILSMKMAALATCTSILCLAFTTATANAQTTAPVAGISTSDSTTDGKYGVQVGINAVYDKTGYDVDEKVSVLPSIFFDTGRYFGRGSQLGVYAMNDEENELFAFVQPAGSSFDAGDAEQWALRGLDDRDWSGMLGASYMRKTPIGGFRGQVATDVIGKSDGTTAKLTYLARLNKGDWTIYPSAGVEWVSEDYNEYYYGITQKESLLTGLPAYDPDSSFSPYLNVNGFYDFDNDWSLFLGQTVSYLPDEQHDSPMVDDHLGFRTTVGMLYEF